MLEKQGSVKQKMGHMSAKMFGGGPIAEFLFGGNTNPPPGPAPDRGAASERAAQGSPAPNMATSEAATKHPDVSPKMVDTSSIDAVPLAVLQENQSQLPTGPVPDARHDIVNQRKL